MKNWNLFPRLALLFSALAAVSAGLFAPRVDQVGAKPVMVYPATSVVISEFRFRGDGGGNDEFIELYNPTGVSIDISGWLIRGSNNAGATSTRATIPAATILLSGQYYLVANTGYSGPTIPDLTYGTGITDDGGVALTLPDTSTIIDQVGLSAGSAYLEGTPQASLGTSNIDRGYERRIGGVDGNCQDDGNNLADFFLVNPSNPQSSLSAFVSCGVPTETPTSTNTATDTATPTSTFTPTTTFTPSNTPVISDTPTNTATSTNTPAPKEVIISEVAWSGTLATVNDEWIELYNTRSTPININGWRLVSDNDGSVDIVLSGVVPGNGFFLLERARDLTVSDVPANQIYTGTLADAGDVLRLSKPDGTVMDTANSDGGAWPAGTGSPNFYSMERLLNGGVAAPDNATGWVSNNQPSTWVAHDAANNLVHGTPGMPNFNYGATLTPTFTATLTLTPTRTPSRTVTPTTFPIRAVVINEVAWAGTANSLPDDEWIELYNPGNRAINLTGWTLRAYDGTPSITLSGVIPAGGYFLLERDDNRTVSNIAADQIYTGTLSNSGEILYLRDNSNRVIDTANGNGGSWPRGSSSTYGSMERIGVSAENDSTWFTNNGTKKNGKNANGGDILGTPKQGNTPAPTATPSKTRTPTRTLPPPTVRIDPRPILNEILPRPGYDWNGDGRTDVYDEFIEIKNLAAIDINLSGWKLDDDPNGGSSPYTLPSVTLKPNERIVFYALDTNILLSDGGDTVRLIAPNGKIYDAYTYTVAKAEDRSICRLPDGNIFDDGWFDDCIPTPNLTNTREGNVPTSPGGNAESPVCDLPDTIPADFFFAECRGYGAGIWNPFYWDKTGWLDKLFIPDADGKWKSFVE
ncbi:MAG: lamin tail domain-containing protein [Chloroflexi bacterium]|nr:lamin tail domain-containing protein [Chloroflexota bacterium]